MILLALKEYYDRKLAEGSIARDGWIRGGLDFLLELDLDGCLRTIADLREGEGKKKTARSFQLPSIGNQALKHSNSGKDANLLWDNAAFVFGLGEKGDLRLKSMIAAIDEWLGEASDAGIRAVRAFLRQGLEDREHFAGALDHPEYGELFKQGGVKISFRVLGTPYRAVFLSPMVEAALEPAVGSEEAATFRGTCLVTGEPHVEVATTHPVIKGVKNTQSSGASIVSFNKDAFLSYSKTQSFNAPVGKMAVSRYVKALNALLESPRQRLQLGDATAVFWADKPSTFETDFSAFFQEPAKDDPDAGVGRVKALVQSIRTGAYVEDSGDARFYILGLSPNNSRLSVRFWHAGTIAEFAARIRGYFDDFAIVKPPKEPDYYPIGDILVHLAVQDKAANIPPSLAGELMRAILEGTPYPTTLLQAALRRIRSDCDNRVIPVRAALIKAYLNRYHRFYPDQRYKEVTPELDTTQTSDGYLLGRMFAVLEKIQEEASPGINATIRERFYGSACATPVTVFANLLRLKNHHLAKLDGKGRVVYFERLLGEIMGHLHEFPAHLSMREQGLFAIGYYHQRQALFTASKKERDTSIPVETGKEE